LKRAPLYLSLFFFLCVPHLRAETVCPWLTQGTAADLLGGEVTAKIQAASADAGSCTFSLHRGATGYALEITVAAAPGATCPPRSPKVPGVGTEAVSCSTKRSPNETTDMISGRVRTTFFAVCLAGKGAPDAQMTPEERSEIVEQVSEEVAGSLF
jgi:hypothetical protein